MSEQKQEIENENAQNSENLQDDLQENGKRKAKCYGLCK